MALPAEDTLHSLPEHDSWIVVKETYLGGHNKLLEHADTDAFDCNDFPKPNDHKVD